MKVIIIDDEPLARSLVKEYLQQYPQIEIVEECNDGYQGIKAIQQHKPDLIFLDIQMPKLNGFEMLELLEECPAVIFTTAFDEYALKAFEAHAVDYLLKPFSKERFDKALEKFMEQSFVQKQKTDTLAFLQSIPIPAHSDRIVIKTSAGIRIFSVHDVHYLEAADDYTKIYTKEGAFLKNRTMSFFESSLPPAQFVRTHRSYIVNLQEITRIDLYEKENYLALLKSGAKIPVSRSGYGRLREALGM